MSNDKSSEKFMQGDKVVLKEEARRGKRSGIVDGYEYYQGVRVWVKEDDGLLYAYPEDDLELVESVELVTSFTALTEAAKDESIMISRRMARGLLDYIAELEGKVLNREKVVVGDVVQIIKDDSGVFNWMVGRIGTVVEIREDDNLHPVVLEFESKLRARAHYTELRRTGE